MAGVCLCENTLNPHISHLRWVCSLSGRLGDSPRSPDRTWGLQHVLTLPSCSGMGRKAASGVGTAAGVSVFFGKAQVPWAGVSGRKGRVLRAGHDQTMLLSQQSHPCDSLSSQETWHDSCEIKISRSTHSRLQLAESWDRRHGFLGLGPSRWLPSAAEESGADQTLSGNSRRALRNGERVVSLWELSPTSPQISRRAHSILFSRWALTD